jgi:dolichyl-phosphate-mannose--protein O-mannosyl transferase
MRSLWHYHHDLYVFHTHFLNGATHTYQSLPRGWLLLNRPVGVDAQTGIKTGERGCTAPKGSDCLKQVLLLGTPALWWGGCVALLGALAMWVGARDWRYGLTIVGVASTWLPWLQYDDRPIFLFYALPCLPFMILASVLLMGRAIGSGTELTRRRTIGVIGSGAFVLLVVVNFIWFYPIFSDQLITHSQWLQRIWFKRWI